MSAVIATATNKLVLFGVVVGASGLLVLQHFNVL